MRLCGEGLSITEGPSHLRACLFLACRPFVTIFDTELITCKGFLFLKEHNYIFINFPLVFRCKDTEQRH